ncbi:hypothetical protein B0F90DRAFT_1667994 [Multifurca ochricompacta]|uniref:Uncharacterized protein n=1 Tax=Multifurca ochricompacta TaxID=376703 RepID=A0AAD4QNP4_9AGAM|nr:hypothetical protein B0F90DRAFT_1667994 [Multifurca ochricompacta]
MTPPTPIVVSPLPTTPKPSTPRRRSHHRSTDESCSSLESSPQLRRPPSSQAVPSPPAPPPPLKGILKTGTSESSVVFRASLVHQDRDGYTSSPEKPISLKTPHTRSSKSRPPQLADSASSNSSTPPATLHWKLLPFDAQRSKGKLKFDFTREVDEIVLGEARRGGSRPLTVLERNKAAAEPGLTEMVIHCAELKDWPVYVARQSVLTTTERTIHQSRVRDIERRRPPTPEGAKKGVRRRDLLEGKTLFLGLDWRPSNSRYTDGCWCLKVGSPPA